MTDRISDRLRKPDAWSAHFHGNGSFSTEEEAAPFEAADLIEEAKAALEEARLHIEASADVFESGPEVEECLAQIDTILAKLKGQFDDR